MEGYLDNIYTTLWNMPHDTLVKVWYHLAKGRWPDILPGKPIGWEAKSNVEKNLYIVPICEEIEEIVGSKGCYRYENKMDGGETGQAYDDLWDSGFLGKIEDLDDKISECRSMLFQIRKDLDHALLFLLIVGGFMIGACISKIVLLFIG